LKEGIGDHLGSHTPSGIGDDKASNPSFGTPHLALKVYG